MEISAFEAAKALQAYRKHKTGGRNGGRPGRCPVCNGFGYTVEMGELVSGVRQILRPECANCAGVGLVAARTKGNLSSHA